ncbi:hypothetical protein XELAEV_18002210mg, partial [Xenopus laevis]
SALELTVAPSHRATVGTDTSIPCTFRVDRRSVDPKLLTILWYFRDKEILRYPGTEGTPNSRLSLNKDRTKDGVASLSLTNVQISDGGLYKCSVGYGSDRKEKEVRLDIQAPPNINITDNVVIEDKESVLSVFITGFYPVDIDVKWLREGEILPGGTVITPQRNADGTYRVNSTLTIVPTKENRTQTFYWRVQHESLSVPLQEGFKLVYGAAPSVSISNKPFHQDMEQTLTCRAWGYYPESIVVSWFMNGTFVQKSKTHRISGSEVESSFQFTPMVEDTGMELLCVVEHGTLKEPSSLRLLVEFTDLRVNMMVKMMMVISAVVCVLLLFATLYHREQQKHKLKVRDIICSEKGEFSLEVDNVFPEPINITWDVAQPAMSPDYKSLQSSLLMSRNQNGTFHVTSTCEHLRDQINPKESFSLRATVAHLQLKQSVCKEWNGTEFMKYAVLRPVIGEITKPIFYPNKKAMIQFQISDYFPDALTVSWYRKEAGKEDLVLVTRSGRYKIPNIIPQKEKDKTLTCTANLSFTPSLSEDEGAEFICRVEHPGLEEAIESRTGLIHVWAKPQVLQPIKLSISDSKEVLCSLFVQNFYPKEISIIWSCTENIYQKIKPGESYGDNPDSTHNVVSTYTIPGDWLKKPDFNVNVIWKHVSMEDPESKEMSLKHPDFPWRPTIEEISQFIWIQDQETALHCKISPYFPDALTVSWMEKRKGRNPQPVSTNGKYKISAMKPERRNDNTYSYTTQLSLPSSSRIEEDLEFICRVEHPSLERPIERSTGNPQFKAAPKQPNPVQWSLSDKGGAVCTLSLHNFYPKPIEVTWIFLTGSQKQESLLLEPQYQPNADQTFNVTSSCSVAENLLQLPDCKIRVTWNHPATKTSESREMSPTDPDFPWCPQVSLKPIGTLTLGREATLQWDISDYFPNALTLTWLLRKVAHEEQILPHDKHNYRMENKPRKTPRGTYISTGYLHFIPSILSHQGAEIVCRVAHPSLAQPIDIGTGALHITVAPGDPEPVRLSISDSGKEIVCSLIVTRFYPKDIHIDWTRTKSHNHHQKIIPSHKVIQVNDDETFNAVSDVTIPSHDFTFPLTVTWNHKSTGQTGKREIYLKARPTVNEIKLGEDGRFYLDANGFYPQKMTISWQLIQGKAQKKVLSPEPEYVENADGTYKVRSTCEIPIEVNRNILYILRATIQHETLPEPISTEIKQAVPQIVEPVEFIQLESGNVLYSVHFRQFYPKNIVIKWLTRDGKYPIMKPTKKIIQTDEEETFDVVSKCEIPGKFRQQEIRVIWEHESLAVPQHIDLWVPEKAIGSEPLGRLGLAQDQQTRINTVKKTSNLAKPPVLDRNEKQTFFKKT